MNYTLNIDWLSFYCLYNGDGCFLKNSAELDWINSHWSNLVRFIPEGANDLHGEITFKKQAYGTRQFKDLFHVYIGKEKFAEIQLHPHSSVLNAHAAIVKIENRRLYMSSMFIDISMFMDSIGFEIVNLSRLDIAADFRKFDFVSCEGFIARVMSSEYRHIGRGTGAAYFVHGSVETEKGNKGLLKFNGLSYGSHSSPIRAYLYNKTLELLTQHDKPYIRDMWEDAGIINGAYDWRSQYVWRLEVSIKSEGMELKKSKSEEEPTRLSWETIRTRGNDPEVWNIENTYFSMLHRVFRFFRNADGITNVSRYAKDHPLELFGPNRPHPFTCAPREVTGGNRTERIIVKSLWQMADTYRAMDDEENRERTQSLARDFAKANDLMDWLQDKRKTWETPMHK